MKKILIIILLLMPILLFGQDKVVTLQKMFKEFEPGIKVIREDRVLVLESKNILDDFSLSYEIGTIFSVLDYYYSVINIDPRKMLTGGIIIKYQDNVGQLNELYYSAEDIYIIKNLQLDDRAIYIQESY